jgi:hypothetical protein
MVQIIGQTLKIAATRARRHLTARGRRWRFRAGVVERSYDPPLSYSQRDGTSTSREPCGPRSRLGGGGKLRKHPENLRIGLDVFFRLVPAFDLTPPPAPARDHFRVNQAAGL